MLQLGIRARLERIEHICMCNELKYAALVFSKLMFVKILGLVVNKTRCAQSAQP